MCYGIHHLFNVVTHAEGIPHAILIRAAKPVKELDTLLLRRGMTEVKPRLTSGPGALSKAMGINTRYSGESLSDNTIWIENIGIQIPPKQIVASPRIGLAYAQEDALLPYRFYLQNSR